MAAHTDDGFHEIQLNGKQLVFLFMAATVVSVVIFLCGVLVGRGVRNQQVSEESAQLSAEADSATRPAATAGVETVQAGSDPTAAAAPPPADEQLSYFDRLDDSKPPREQLKTPEQLKAEESKAAAQRAAAAKVPEPIRTPPPARAPAVSSNVARTPERPAAVASNSATPPAGRTPAPAPAKPTPAAASTAAPASPTAPGEPQGAGYAVQIAALNLRSEADAIAKRLTSKGYAAYVLAPGSGTPQIFRVRVGKFDSRREAETIATKLEKEEQFKPWITR